MEQPKSVNSTQFQTVMGHPLLHPGPGHMGFSGSVALEDGIPGEVANKLRAMGHPIEAGVSGNARAEDL